MRLKAEVREGTVIDRGLIAVALGSFKEEDPYTS